MHLPAQTIALVMAASLASVMVWDCNKEQHQNWCPDYSLGPACYGTMSWGHCDRGCAESVHVTDRTWSFLRLGLPCRLQEAKIQLLHQSPTSRLPHLVVVSVSILYFSIRSRNLCLHIWSPLHLILQVTKAHRFLHLQ